MVKRVFFSTCILLSGLGSFAQSQAKVIKLDNPSFEDFPSIAKVPQGWYNCGFQGESEPDIQPGGFDVVKPANNGATYLGLVVRDVNTWESVGQRLKSPILKGTTYRFSLFACRSELYMSESQLTRKKVNYITPVIIRVWAGSGYCVKDELLGETEPISSANWQRSELKFTPKSSHGYIMIEAFYKVPTLFPYNGNVLIDNLSDIVPEKKDEPKKEKPPVATVKPPVKTPTKPTDTPIASTDAKPNVVTPTKTKPESKPEEPAENNVTDSRIKEGQIIKIEKLQFKPQSSEIEQSSFPELDKLYQMLAGNPSLIVEIGGHTNLMISDEAMSYKLSTERARAVADYLVKKGIERNRLVTRGYGKSRPLVNETSAAANRLNQRVEIKILSTNG